MPYALEVGTQFAITLPDFFKEGYGCINHKLAYELGMKSTGYWVFTKSDKQVVHKYASVTKDQLLTSISRGWTPVYVRVDINDDKPFTKVIDTLITITTTDALATHLDDLYERDVAACEQFIHQIHYALTMMKGA